MRPYIIAEIGCNHKGDIEVAKALILCAKYFCGVDAVKFQKRNNKELLTEEEYNAPHPNPINSYGKTYGEHREFLEFTVNQHKQLKEFCESHNIAYSTSVWDLTSTKEIVDLNPEFIKVPSATNNNFKVLEYLCDNYKGDIHLSLGMTTKEEIEQIVQFFINKNRNKSLVLYSCTSGYPVPYKDICLLEIKKLYNLYGDVVKAIGFSGHHIGIYPDIAAFSLGANIIERHFTLNHDWKGTDHKASLEPHEMKELVEALTNVNDALAYKQVDLLDIEKAQRHKLKYKK